jgi:ubiquinone/menaquinone biosynthesis C-methylase UbiE
MQVQEYKNIYSNESSHFFYVANHTIIISLLKKYLSIARKPTKILDAGCGTGLLAKKLKMYGQVVGVDISPEALKYAKKRGIKVIKGSVDNLPFTNNSFDVITCMDVIYHKQVNDKNALHEFFRVLSPGGILILRVPANNWLKLKHDRHVHSRQRYSKKEINRKIQDAGFTIKKLSYINSPLLPFAILNHFKEKVLRESDSSSIGELPKPINKFITYILLMELNFLAKFNIPFGLGVIVVAQKPTK